MRKSFAMQSLLVMLASAAGVLQAEEKNPMDEARSAFARGDYSQVVVTFQAAADKGNVEAQDALGMMYFYGLGVAVNKDEEVKWDSKAAQNGKLDARYRLLQDDGSRTGTYAQFVNKKREYAQFANEVISNSDKIAKSGDPMTEFTLGRCIYQEGSSGDNYKQALIWFMKAAQAGIPPAQEVVGFFYERGYGEVGVNPKESASWYEKAAQAGLVSAQTSLGLLLGNHGDKERSKFWLTKAALLGSQSASYFLRKDYGLLVGDCSEIDRQAAIQASEEAGRTDEESKRLAQEAYPSKYKPSPAQQNFIVKAAAVTMFGIITNAYKEYSSLSPEEQAERNREGEAELQRERLEQERVQGQQRMDDALRDMQNKGP
jgi:TPR repeat protein